VRLAPRDMFAYWAGAAAAAQAPSQLICKPVGSANQARQHKNEYSNAKSH